MDFPGSRLRVGYEVAVLAGGRGHGKRVLFVRQA